MRKLGYATVAIMRAIAEGAIYGLDIMDRTGLPSGTVYPTLQRLERRGYASGRWESEWVASGEGRPRRRYYRLTGIGEAALSAAVRDFRSLARGLPSSRPEEA